MDCGYSAAALMHKVCGYTSGSRCKGVFEKGIHLSRSGTKGLNGLMMEALKKGL